MQLKNQQGFTLMEALVSILVLSLGAMAMLGVQIATLAETQNSVRRAQAVRIIEDLAERIKSNPGGFDRLNDYTNTAWAAVPSAPSPGCDTNSCNATQLAQWDRNQWFSQIPQLIPGGQARTFLSADEAVGNRRQLGVMLAWPLQQRAVSAFGTPEKVTTGSGANAVACPDEHICHLLYIQP